MATAEKKPKKMGRPKNQNYLPWEEAREFMRSEMIPSRGKFLEWWERNKPKAIPRFPYRVYKEWITWNDFLGNNNEFNNKIGTKWRTLSDAVLYTHTLKLETQSQWMEYARTGALPKDIPARPDLVYDKWRSWGHWLGNTPAEIIEVQREAARTSIFYVVNTTTGPSNILTFGVDPNGFFSLQERCKQRQWSIIRLFWNDPEKSQRIKEIINYLSTPYMGDDDQRIVPNVWELLYHIEISLDRITKIPAHNDPDTISQVSDDKEEEFLL